MESAAGRKLLTDIKRELVDRGHALDKGNIDLERIVEVAAVSDQVKTDALGSDKEVEAPTPVQSVAHTQHQRNWRRRTSRAQPQHRQSGCYVCGKDHLMRFCPKKCCLYVGILETLLNCPQRKSGPRQKILQKNGVHSDQNCLSYFP